jgi:hypothetical protein
MAKACPETNASAANAAIANNDLRMIDLQLDVSRTFSPASFGWRVPPAPIIGLGRVMKIWHAAGIAFVGRGVGPIEPPIIARVAIRFDMLMVAKDRWLHR